jgi:hypothetical protein
MSDTPKKRGGSRLGVALLSAIAAIAVSGVVASAASAAVIPFPNSSVDLGPLAKNQDITPDANALTVDVTPDGEGDFEIEPADWNFPAAEVTILTNTIELDLLLTENATGNFNLATGALSLDAPGAVIMATINQGCAITTPMAFSTSNTQTRPDSNAFQGTAIDLVTTPMNPTGAIAANWSTLPDATALVPQCEQEDLDTINGITKGSGGLWFGLPGTTTPTRQVKPAPAPVPPAATPPASKKCKKGFKKVKGKC